MAKKEPVQIQINITGPVRSGRTSLVMGIARRLQEAGVDVVIGGGSLTIKDGDGTADKDFHNLKHSGVRVSICDYDSGGGSISM